MFRGAGTPAVAFKAGGTKPGLQLDGGACPNKEQTVNWGKRWGPSEAWQFCNSGNWHGAEALVPASAGNPDLAFPADAMYSWEDAQLDALENWARERLRKAEGCRATEPKTCGEPKGAGPQSSSNRR